jgi:phage gp46-like protein
MPDIRVIQTAGEFSVTLDWLLQPWGLDQTQELTTAVIIALGTDSLAGASDRLPDPDSDDRRGWWGDIDADEIWDGWPLGCRLWLLWREKIVDANAQWGSTVARAQLYAYEAVQPFIDKRICSGIDIQAARTGIDRIDVAVTLFRGPLPAISLLFQGMWDEFIRNALGSPPAERLRPLSLPPA